MLNQYHTLYTLYNKNRKNILIPERKSGAVCFSAYNNNTSYNYLKDRIIEISILKQYPDCLAEMVFSKEQIIAHLDKLNELGFKNSLLEREDRYIVTLFESDYINKTHVRISLDYIRLLWEKDVNQILKIYYSIPSTEWGDLDYLVILQSIQNTMLRKIRWGHKLASNAYGYRKNAILSSNAVLEYINSRPNPSKDYEGSFNLWGMFSESSLSEREIRQIQDIKIDGAESVKKVLQIVNP